MVCVSFGLGLGSCLLRCRFRVTLRLGIMIKLIVCVG